jgi:hypothetical protein
MRLQWICGDNDLINIMIQFDNFNLFNDAESWELEQPIKFLSAVR